MNAGLIYTPRPAQVAAGDDGRPLSLDGVAVEAEREEWVVEDRWWSEQPIDRHYFELALADGRCEVVFRERGIWFQQRA